ncbi:MAG TPA: membrane protein insertase YidC [Firmicutes bacterium]|nr:MAG: hypothetical protein AA931_08435 [Peptococcaceae bacterium 1109]HHT74096.1 membrane protein insertase YidC [Bacillota bacterium]
MLKWLTDILLWLLESISEAVGSYGLGIIIVTILLRVVLYPLTISQTKSMAKMKKLQPELNEIQKKYKDKPEEYQKRTIELYQKHGVNPLGGCLPMLIQLPILWAFFPVLREIPTSDLTMFMGIWELSKPDPYYIMPLLAAATTWWQSKVTSTGDSSQNTMMIVMPIMIGMFSISFPSGLVLYWITSNILGVVQQIWINKQVLSAEQGGKAK